MPPPYAQEEVPENFEDQLVTRWDLFQSYLTNVMFYAPMNLVVLEEVQYDFDRIELSGEAETKRTNLKYIS